MRNLAPSFGLQFFGHVAIDGATEVMTLKSRGRLGLKFFLDAVSINMIGKRCNHCRYRIRSKPALTGSPPSLL
jgi:hypothetical protein